MAKSYYRHPNGGGRILNLKAEVSPEAFLGETSMVGHGARVLGNAVVTHSKIAGSARIFGAEVRDSVVGTWLKDDEGRPREYQPPFPIVEGEYVKIYSSLVLNEEVSSSLALTIRGCELYDRVVVRGSVELSYVVARGRARIFGTARAFGAGGAPVFLHSMMHVHEGEWLVAPQYHEVGTERGEGINVGITECAGGRALVGCVCKPIEAWLARKTWHLPLEMGWARGEVEEVRGVLEAWRDDAD
jgi:hypothetical protein